MRSTASTSRRALTDDRHGTDYSQRFLAYLHDIQDQDLTLGIAMTDAKGDRSKRPGQQVNPDVYVHIKERRSDGIVIRGAKAIVTGAPYMHEFLVMPCRTHDPGGQRLRRVLRRALSTRPGSRSSRARRDVQARRRPSSPPNTASRSAS